MVLSPKYVLKQMERFGMVDCKFVSTPMELNFKKLCGNTAGPVLANPTEYRQLVGALMFLVNSHSNVFFAVNTLSQHMVETSSHPLDWCQEYIEISSGHNQPWAKIHYREFETPWIY